MSPLPVDLGNGVVLRCYEMSDLDALWDAIDEERARLGGVGLMVGPFGIAGEIGHWIRAKHEGRGHITRACRALIDIGFEELGLHRLEIRAGLENARSRAVPERLGFTHEGVGREGSRGSRGFYDLAVYSLLDREWRS
jgi:ribosomal-protein-serine acetyltransferase